MILDKSCSCSCSCWESFSALSAHVFGRPFSAMLWRVIQTFQAESSPATSTTTSTSARRTHPDRARRFILDGDWLEVGRDDDACGRRARADFFLETLQSGACLVTNVHLRRTERLPVR